MERSYRHDLSDQDPKERKTDRRTGIGGALVSPDLPQITARKNRENEQANDAVQRHQVDLLSQPRANVARQELRPCSPNDKADKTLQRENPRQGEYPPTALSYPVHLNPHRPARSPSQ